jgi:glutathione peroxidase-family protein/uncharacterized membrane protein
MKTSFIQNVLRFLLGAFMTLAGVGHLTVQRQEFLAQVPRWLPSSPGFMDFVVLSSGVVEIALGLAMMLWSKQKQKVGLVLAIFFVLIFPGNVSQYTNGIDAFGLDTDTKRLVRLFFQPVLILWALWSTGALQAWRNNRKEEKEWKDKSFYDFEAIDIRGKLVKMSDFKGKKVVVVNTASKCGLTPQYEGLEKMFREQKDKDLVVLGFPCNQFAKQENGSEKEIAQFCEINYGVSFPIFSKVDVNGDAAHPLFKYLKSNLKGFPGNAIKWNFTKFIIDKNGRPVKRFAPTVKPEVIAEFVKNKL